MNFCFPEAFEEHGGGAPRHHISHGGRAAHPWGGDPFRWIPNHYLNTAVELCVAAARPPIGEARTRRAPKGSWAGGPSGLAAGVEDAGGTLDPRE